MRISMAKGTETEEFVVLSKVRTGLKREFAFALKSQNEIAGSLGRTRARRAANGLNEAQEAPSSKRIKKSGPGSRKDDAEGVNVVDEGCEELAGGGGGDGPGKGENDAKMVVENEGDLKSDVVDAISDDENKSHSVESLRTENDTGLTMVASDDERKCVSDDSKGNAVVPPSDVETEEVTEKEKSAVVVNTKDEEIQDLPGQEVFVTPIKPGKRFTRSSLSSTLEESKDLPKTGEDGEGDGKASSSSVVPKNVDKLSTNSLVKMIPNKLKDLLDTGLLEGLSVRYSRGVKRKFAKENDLQGVVRGSGILCNCEECKGMEVVAPTVFEVHAGSSNKRPPDYIYMDNGNTFRDVLNSCKDSHLDDFEATIRRAIGRATKEKITYCIDCNGSISSSGRGRRRLRCEACTEMKTSKETPKRGTKACDRPSEQVVHKSSDCAKKSAASGNKSQGKLTRKDLRLHKLVFEGDVLPNGTEVGYYVHGKKTLSGYKQGSGILCSCCQKEVSPSQFEAHAGWASRRKPYLHIYTSNGVSLHELSVSLSRSRKFLTEENDDLCSICCQPGNLLCCDGCPRAFHKECIPLLKVPNEKWYCRYCDNMFQREKFAERNANAIAAGRVAGVDPIEQIAHRCIRIVKTQDQESDSGGCALCRAHDFAKGGFSHRTVILCDQCEREFHVGCLREHGMQDLKELPEGKWFCSSGCNRINSVLQQLLEDGDQQIPDCLLNIIKQKHAATGHEDVKLDIKWRLLSGKMSAGDNTRALLSKAVSVFHEQFDPIVLANSNQDMIPHMVYGRNVKDKEFGGMYCAVLTVNSVIVSAGLFRIFGKDIAELPLVATASGHEKLGYFQVLYLCIEKLLGELDVNHLWLPAADEAKPLWTNRFGFSDFPTDEFVEVKKQFALMIFDGTFILRKSVPKEHNALDLLGGAMQATDALENRLDLAGIVSMDGAVKVFVSEDIGVTANTSKDDATNAPVGSSILGEQASGALQVNLIDVPKDGELGVSNDGAILASQRSLDGAQDTGELLDNMTEALKGGDFVASSADCVMQVSEIAQDTADLTLDDPIEVSEVGEIRISSVDGAVQGSGSPQEDGKQDDVANTMELEVGVSKEEGATRATSVFTVLPDGEMEFILDEGDFGASLDQEDGDQ